MKKKVEDIQAANTPGLNIDGVVRRALIIKTMNWTEPQKAKEGVSWYDHVVLETPIGRAIIEWKSWKDSPSYDVQIGNDWVGCESDLDTAKKLARIYLKTKYDELGQLLS